MRTDTTHRKMHPMTERTDRVAAAERLLTYLASRDGGPDVTLSAEAVTQAAQVHATLAIAEQLRIANLVALATARHPMLSEQVAEDAARTLAVFVPHSMGGYFHVRPDIAAALGIEIAAT